MRLKKAVPLFALSYVNKEGPMKTFQDNEQNNFNFRFDLLTGLSRFGLNPAEWDLIPESSNRLIIQNKKEPSLSLRGQVVTKNTRTVWRAIELASL